MQTLFPSREAGWMRADEWLTKRSFAPTPVPTRSYERVYSWCKVRYPKSWRVKAMTSHIWKWEDRIARRLAALRELAKRRIAACSPQQFLVRERYCAVLAMIERAESRIAKLACRSAKRIKARLARLAAALEQCSEPKQNGVSSAAPPPFTPPSDDPEYDELWEDWVFSWNLLDEYESWCETWGMKDKESDLDLTEAHLPSSRSLHRLLKAKMTWGDDNRKDTKSWKSNRRTKWRVLGNPSIVLS